MQVCKWVCTEVVDVRGQAKHAAPQLFSEGKEQLNSAAK